MIRHRFLLFLRLTEQRLLCLKSEVRQLHGSMWSNIVQKISVRDRLPKWLGWCGIAVEGRIGMTEI